ncbi:MAG: TolB family protein, partial [Rhodopirellula sp. JB055]|uniref:TolB family protein n=1 Tax=Rhodopirellula sp. JB055 TaxID=3342846 RepID=UPI00370A4793
MFDRRDPLILKSLLTKLLPCWLLMGLAILLGGNATAIAQDESDLLSNVRKLTFEGRRAGEGYFSADGTRMVFQSERDPSNPFYQIYVSDLETGDIQRVSPGFGKTTCGWIHPNGKKVLFASTHADPDSERLQQEELDFRASGESRRYSLDYDPNYEIYAADLDRIEPGTTQGLTAL